MNKFILAFLISFTLISGGASAQIKLPKPDHVVILILENHGLAEIIGSADAPYINSLADSGANYLMLFSGSNQGMTDNSIPPNLPLTSPNLGAALLEKGLTFTGYSEELPSAGYTGEAYAGYVRKHNPWVNWQGTGVNGIAPALNQPLTSFPVTGFQNLPTVSIIVPNLIHDMHDGPIAQGDQWVKENFDAYVRWAKENNSLFILTFDEDDRNHNNNITTIFTGSNVKKGKYDKRIDHLSVLRTIEDIYELSHSGASATNDPITDCWLNSPLSVKSLAASPLKSLNVFPNPSTNQDVQVNLTNDWKGNVEIVLYDITGKKLKEVKLSKDSTRLSTIMGMQSVEKGIYFIEARFGTKKEIQRIEKN